MKFFYKKKEADKAEKLHLYEKSEDIKFAEKPVDIKFAEKSEDINSDETKKINFRGPLNSQKDNWIIFLWIKSLVDVLTGLFIRKKAGKDENVKTGSRNIEIAEEDVENGGTGSRDIQIARADVANGWTETAGAEIAGINASGIGEKIKQQSISEKIASRMIIAACSLYLFYMSFFTYMGISSILIDRSLVGNLIPPLIDLAVCFSVSLIFLIAVNGPVKRSWRPTIFVKVCMSIMVAAFVITGILYSHTKLFYGLYIFAIFYFVWQIKVTDRTAFFLDNLAKGLTVGTSIILIISLILEPIGKGVYFGIFVNPNGLAPLASLGFFASFYLSREKFIYAWPAGLSLFVGLCSNSRTFVFTIVFAGLCYLIRTFCTRGREILSRLGFFAKSLAVYVLVTIIFINAIRPVFYNIHKIDNPIQSSYNNLKKTIYNMSYKDGVRLDAAGVKPLEINTYPSNKTVYKLLFARTERTFEESRLLMDQVFKKKGHKKPGQLGAGRFSFYERFSEERWFKILDRLTSRRASIWAIYMDNLKISGQQKRQFELEDYSLPFFANPHNIVMTVAYDSGLISGLAFLLLVFSLLKKSTSFMVHPNRKDDKKFAYMIFISFFSPMMLGTGTDPFGNYSFFCYLACLLIICQGERKIKSVDRKITDAEKPDLIKV